MPAVLTFPKLPQRGSSVLHTHAHPFFSINFFLMTRRYFKHLLVDGWQRINKCLGGGPRGIRMLWLNDQRVTSAKRCSQCQVIRGRHDLGARAKSCVPLRRMWRIAYTYAHTHRGQHSVYPRGWGCSFHSFSLASVRQAFPWYVLPCSACLCTHSENSFQIRPRDLAQE